MTTDLGPLAARVSEPLRGRAAYHVPVPPNLVAKLDANELPYGLPADLRSKLTAALSEVALERYPDPRASQLRAAVARSLGVAGDRLVFGNGSDELISLLACAFPGPLLYPTPTFVYYRLAAVARGLPTVEVPLDERWQLDESATIAAIERARPTVVFLALPNNPTGTLWRIDFACELAARFRDTVIVSDEAYVGYSGVSNLGALPAHPNLVVMRTLSKLGMAGLRVGFTISAPAIAGVLDIVRPPYNVSALDQRAAEILVADAASWCTARAAEVVAERGRLAEALAGRGFEVFDSAANLLLIRCGDARGIYDALAVRGISVRAFGPGPLGDCLRVTVGTPTENAALLAALP